MAVFSRPCQLLTYSSMNTAAALLELQYATTSPQDWHVKMLDTCYPGYTCEPNNLDFAPYSKKFGITVKQRLCPHSNKIIVFLTDLISFDLTNVKSRF